MSVDRERRRKPKPQLMAAVTAWDTATGTSVWMRPDGTWSEKTDEMAVFERAEAAAALEKAEAQQDVVTEPYITQVTPDRQIAGRNVMRETIRANGPTVAYGVIV
ncbi:MAG: DUF2849 domain-containing protein [Pseudomonadota bacterium]